MRRKFIDGVISQNDKVYLDQIIRYNKVLLQRNSLLKHFNITRTFDQDTIEIYNDQLSQMGNLIFNKRKEFIEMFSPIFLDKYRTISNNKEVVNLNYKSQLKNKKLKELLKSNIEKDKTLQFTSAGTHKDDIEFIIGNYPIKKFGSQGQQKSFLIALKLAQYEVLKAKSGNLPILLLDDIFDKLDSKRVEQIIKMVNDSNFGQLFISDTDAKRTENVVKSSHKNYEIFKLWKKYYS